MNKKILLICLGVLYAVTLYIGYEFVYHKPQSVHLQLMEISSPESLSAIQKHLFLDYILYVVAQSIIFSMILVIIRRYHRVNKKLWMQRDKDSRTDLLTGIPNQRQLLIDLEETVSPNLAFIKILNYNSFINNYGPAVTDNIVKQFGTIISKYKHPNLKKDSFYRVQESTFAILEDSDITFEGIAEITAEIVKALITYDYIIGDGEFTKINVTVGAVRQKQDAFTLANMALSEAIEKNLPYYFINESEKSLPKSYKRDLHYISQLHLAIREDRLVPFFQPIFNAKTMKVEKYESLARIVDENNQPIIFPNVFMPLADRAKVYYKVTRIMVRKSIQFAKENNTVVSINLGISDINNSRTCQFVLNAIKQSQVAHLLQFELLENEAIINSNSILSFIKSIQKMGSKVGMDDLGKGYSNIERLLSLPIDFVKLDRSIMEHIGENLEVRNITKGIIKLAHKKNLSVTAEFCSNQMITDMAKMLGADYLQGFYFSEAKPDIYTPPKEQVAL